MKDRLRMYILDSFKNFENYQVYQLEISDIPEILTFMKQSDDFSELVEGRPYGELDAINLLNECPPGIPINKKFVLAFKNPANQIEAIIDLAEGYPETNIWFIGLLLIPPRYRGKGLGSRIILAVEKTVSQGKGDTLRLGVVEKNIKAIEFWKKNNFELFETRPPAMFGLKEHRVIIFQKRLNK